MNLSAIRSKMVYFVLIPILLLGGILTPAFALEIRVKELTTVKGEKIFLGDIASFTPADDGRVNQLQHIEIGSAPPPGVHHKINENLLIYKIGSFISKYDDIHITIPETSRVCRSAQIIGSDRLEEIFKEYVVKNSPWPLENLRFDRISTPETIMLPEGKLYWEIQEKLNRDFIGNIALTLVLFVDGKQVRKVPLSGRISINQDVLKAALKINAGQIITANDLIITTENNQRFQKNFITKVVDAVGKRAVRNIQAGQTILSNMIETPPLVKKGHRVLIKAENEEIRITTLGKVLEDGRSGDQVKVINVSSGKEIFATVTGPGLVEVRF